MHADATRLTLINDAIDRIIVNAGASHCWHNLAALIRPLASSSLDERIAATLAAHVPDHGLPGFYLATLLDQLNGDPRHMARAGAILTSLRPVDADRLVAFLHIAAQLALLRACDRPDFEQRLRAAALPALSAMLGQLLDARRPPRPPEPRRQPLQRVALIAPELSDISHPPTLMALEQAQVLVEQGITVQLFTCQETGGPDYVHLLGNGAVNRTPAIDLGGWLDQIGHGVAIHSCDQRFSALRRWTDMLDSIDAFGPDLVLSVGLHTGLAASLYQRYPLLAMASNSICPLVPADVWLSAQARLGGQVAQPWGASLPAAEAWYHPYRVRRKPAGAPCTRAELGLPPTGLLLMTMGTHLASKISGTWAQQMRARMARHPELVWLVVGGDGARPPELAGLDPQRLRLHAYTPQARAMLAQCDIYLTAPAMGGGFSVAEAMALGLPVLSMADSDGGDKLGEAAAPDIDSYFSQLDQLIASAEARARCGAALKARFDQALDLAASGPSLLAACERALQRFHARSAR